MALVSVNSEVNARRMANVEQCFGKMGESLAQFGRVLVGEGVLVKMCRKKPKQRQFFLFNDILVYGNIVISKKRYNKQRILRLEGVQVEDLEDEGNLKHGWIIKTPAKSFAVYAATETEKREWMLHIERCVSDLLGRGWRIENWLSAIRHFQATRQLQLPMRQSGCPMEKPRSAWFAGRRSSTWFRGVTTVATADALYADRALRRRSASTTSTRNPFVSVMS